MKGLVVIPAYNEGKVILSVLNRLPKKVLGVKFDSLVVDDGSTDNTYEKLLFSKTSFVSHVINRGLGAALGTGFEYARIHNYDFLVTLDGDGQHDPDELPNLFRPVFKNKADFVVGSRIYQKGMPMTRRIITFMASLITYAVTGFWTTDSQSGFRVFSRKAITNIFIEVDRMEVSSDFFRQAQEKKLKVLEVPIKPIYTEYSFKKGQNLLNSFNIVAKLALQKLIK